ncbi:MAG: RNA polymerase Rpb4 family protein [Candidatus Undinarchaeales archaeon]|jgi:DNA-directed RNA polymerase subunit F|nr:RNA polymerase Rpb4 family protein [Candidatus Undinarchaeales archaeon]
MIGKRALSQEPVSLANVKDIITERKKQGELSYEQNLTLEYCKKFIKLSTKDTAKLIEELVQLEKLNQSHAISLADVMPSNPEEVKLVFAKEHFVLGDEELSQILEILNKYRKK